MITISKVKLFYIIFFSAFIGVLITLINPIKKIKNMWRMYKGTVVVRARGKSIATLADIDNLLSMLSKIDQNIAFLSFFPQEEQFEVYKKIIMDNVVNNYVYQEYIKDKALDQKENFKNHLYQYLKMMKGNFYSTYLQEEIVKNLTISDNEAIEFYELNKENMQVFFVHPFIKKLPGIEARAIKIDGNDAISDKDKSKLYEGNDVIVIERINSAMRGVSPILLYKLKDMKDGDINDVILENGVRYALYRIKEHNGEWVDGVKVIDQIKEVMKNKIMNNKLEDIYNEISGKYNIFINEELLRHYIMTKNKELISEDSALGSIVEGIQDADENKENVAEGVVV